MKKIYIKPIDRIVSLDEEDFLAASVQTGLHISDKYASTGGFGDDALTNQQSIWSDGNTWLEE